MEIDLLARVEELLAERDSTAARAEKLAEALREIADKSERTSVGSQIAFGALAEWERGET